MMTRALIVSCAALAAMPAAVAQPKPPKAPPPGPAPLVGLTKVGAHVPDRGFIDDAYAVDGDRLAVVVTDGDAMVEARVLGGDGAAVATVTLGAIAREVRRLYLLGDRLFVVGGGGDEGAPVTGTLIGLDAKVVKVHKPATDLFVRKLDGKDAVIAYTRSATKKGVVHKVQALELLKGKAIAKRGGQLTVGADGREAKLDFRPAYFLDDMTVAVGLKGGVWRKAEHQRSPDTAAAYDLLTGTWTRDEPITDVVGHTRRLEVMAAGPSPGERVSARMRDDLTAVEVWRDGAPAAVTLDQPVELYDPASLGYAWRGDRLWLGLKVDPVNPPAVARKKADPEYFDLFEVDGDQAVRRARVLAPKQKLRFGFAGDVLWVMERNLGFDRGSKAITFYRVGA